MNPVHWFEISVNDMDRAKKFYESVLGLQLDLNRVESTLMAWFPTTEGGAGCSGALLKSEGRTPSHHGTMIYFSVSDIEAVLARVEAAGGRTLTPRTDIGEYGFYAYFEDSEGNRVGLHSSG
ncbi:MAG: VOC family protein [Acidobacteria bacterium]|nr:VOC family protein [Acidobacteriota bacterium]